MGTLTIVAPRQGVVCRDGTNIHVDKARESGERIAMRSSFPLGVVCGIATACLLASPLVACRRADPSRAPAPHPGPAAGTAGKARSGEPTIDFDVRVHDFGLVNEGTTLKHVFQVRNKGTAPLVVSDVRTSCGCTVAALGASTIPPGGSGPLEVSMDTHGQHGEGKRSIEVSSNDPRQPTSTLEIKYDVRRLLSLDRSFVQLTTTRGSNRTERVWLSGELVKQARLRLDVEGTRLVTARAIDIREAGQPRKGLELKLKGKQPASGEGALTIKTGLPTPPELSLPFRYEVN
jgi:hypothetical protein